MVLLACLLISCMFLQPGMAGAQDQLTDNQDWILVKATAAGQIYQRTVNQSSVPMIMITTTFKADPARVHAVVTDYDHFAEFIPNVLESRVLMDEDNTQWVFHHLQFPGPVADRVYVLKSTDSRNFEDYDYRVEWQLSQRQFPGIDRCEGIEPRTFTGFWTLRSSAGADVTEARYAVHSEPGGMIPAWVIKTMTQRYVQQVIEAVRNRLELK